MDVTYSKKNEDYGYSCSDKSCWTCELHMEEHASVKNTLSESKRECFTSIKTFTKSVPKQPRVDTNLLNV